MAWLTPTNKQYLGIGTAVLSGLILLMGTIPFLNIGITYSILGFLTLGQLLGILNLVLAYLLWKKDLR